MDKTLIDRIQAGDSFGYEDVGDLMLLARDLKIAELERRIAELESELAEYKHTPKAYEIMEADMLEAEAERDRLREALDELTSAIKIIEGRR